MAGYYGIQVGMQTAAAGYVVDAMNAIDPIVTTLGTQLSSEVSGVTGPYVQVLYDALDTWEDAKDAYAEELDAYACALFNMDFSSVTMDSSGSSVVVNAGSALPRTCQAKKS